MIYKDLWKFLKETRYYFFAALAIFFISAILGYFFPIFFVDYIKNFIQELALKTQGMNYWQLFLFILQNNLMTAAISVILGAVLGIVPISMAFFNGYILGFVSKMAVGVSGHATLLKLLPHGIFEIPALILSLGIGMRLGFFVFSRRLSRKKFLELARNSMMAFIYVVILLLIIAAIIETSLIIVLK